VPLEYFVRSARQNPNFTSQPDTVGFKIRMLRNPFRDRGNPGANIPSNGKPNWSVIRSHAEMFTKLPYNRSRRRKIKKNGRQNIGPCMIKLTQIVTTHKCGTVMCNLNKVMKKPFP